MYAHAIVTFIESARAFADRPVVTAQQPLVGNDGFVRFYRTLRIEGPQRFGHTTAIRKLIQDYPESVVVVESYKLANNSYGATKIMNPFNVLERSCGMHVSPYVFVDGASRLMKGELDAIYTAFGHHNGIFFVLIG
jgi:hypothetical protein